MEDWEEVTVSMSFIPVTLKWKQETGVKLCDNFVVCMGHSFHVKLTH